MEEQTFEPSSAIFNFKFPDDVMARFDQFERGSATVALSGKHIDEDIMSGVILGALAKSSTKNTGTCTKYMNKESAISAVSKTKCEGKGGEGKKGKKGDSNG